MIALLGTFFFGIGAIGFFNDGKSGSGWVCIVLILVSWLISSSIHEDAKARVNRRRYWAHYYDRDRAAARRGRQLTPAEKRRLEKARRLAQIDDEEEFYDLIFDDDEW